MADPEEDGAAVQTLVAAQAATRANLTAQSRAMAEQAARSFRHWYETDAIAEWAAKLAARIEALQRSQAATTDAYLTRAVSQIIGKRLRAAGRVDVTGLRAGITHAGAYARAADVYRWRQSRIDAFTAKLIAANLRDGVPVLDDVDLAPLDLTNSVEAAVQRVIAVADLDIQLADRAQSQRTIDDLADTVEITGRRRVIHPELSKGGTCGLCIAASDRIYRVDQLRPIHARCECTDLPIIGDRDPGSGLNNLDLGRLYSDAGGTTDGRKLKQTRYRIDEHGELGPVLTAKKIRSRAETRRDTRRTGPGTGVPTRQQLEAALRQNESARERAEQMRAADPEKWSRYADTVQQRITDLQAQLAA